jgi:predicted nucleotidyltransferase
MMKNPIEALPEGLRKRLQGLQGELVRSLGDNLVALLVFGSAARGEYREETSDVDLVVVVKEATAAALEAMANPLQVARSAARIEAMVLVAEEIPRAADVFPLFYDDLRSSHVVLHGVDPFSSLEIADHHRRLRIEQELRESAIRLRRAVIDAGGSPRHLTGVIERKIKQIRGPMRALLGLHGKRVGVALSEVMEASGAHYKIDVAPFFRVREDPRAALQALQRLLYAAVDDVDRMEVPG